MKAKLKENFSSFVSSSSVQGIKAIAGNESSRFARIFWAISIILATFFFSLYVSDAYVKWRVEPDILVRVNQKNIKEIPFPALSLRTPLFARDYYANSIKFAKELFRYRTKKGDKPNMTATEASYLMANFHACHPAFPSDILTVLPNRTESNIVKLLNESSLQTDEALFGCAYRQEEVQCSKMFNRILTDRGFYYAFNMLGHKSIYNGDIISKDFDSYKRQHIRKSPYVFSQFHGEEIDEDSEKVQWSLEGGYTPDHDVDTIPIAAQKVKPVRAVFFLSKSDAENHCTASFKTFNYFIHLPNEIPIPLHRRYSVKFGDFKFMMLTAKMYSASEELRIFSPEARGCYFDGERKLKFFKSYTKMNCEYECMANYTLKVCGCAKFSNPREEKTPVCGDHQARCYFDATNEYSNYDVVTRKSDSCNCLNTCSDIKYRVDYEEVSKAELSMLPIYVRSGQVINEG
jgi:amiloride-sensitive sodium channel